MWFICVLLFKPENGEAVLLQSLGVFAVPDVSTSVNTINVAVLFLPHYSWASCISNGTLNVNIFYFAGG